MVTSADLKQSLKFIKLYFPFLACEVKCGARDLDVADRQNAHSMTLVAPWPDWLWRDELTEMNEESFNRKGSKGFGHVRMWLVSAVMMIARSKVERRKRCR